MATDYKGVSCIMPFIFAEDLATLSTEADITPCGITQAIGFIVPFDGSIVGLSATHVVLSTYDITLSVQVSDTDEFTATLAKEANTEIYASYMPGTYEVVAGENITVTAQWATGTTSDDGGETLVTVFVQVGSSGT